MSKNDEENSEEKKKKKKKDEEKVETIIRVEAPKTRLITAFVMLSGSAFVAIYTYLQHYEIGAWLTVLFFSLVIFLIIGRLLEWLIAHFNEPIKERDRAILAQEEAIAAREADEQAALEAEQRAAEEEAAHAAEEVDEGFVQVPDEFATFGESDEFSNIIDTTEF